MKALMALASNFHIFDTHKDEPSSNLGIFKIWKPIKYELSLVLKGKKNTFAFVFHNLLQTHKFYIHCNNGAAHHYKHTHNHTFCKANHTPLPLKTTNIKHLILSWLGFSSVLTKAELKIGIQM